MDNFIHIGMSINMVINLDSALFTPVNDYLILFIVLKIYGLNRSLVSSFLFFGTQNIEYCSFFSIIRKFPATGRVPPLACSSLMDFSFPMVRVSLVF